MCIGYGDYVEVFSVELLLLVSSFISFFFFLLVVFSPDKVLTLIIFYYLYPALCLFLTQLFCCNEDMSHSTG